MKRLARAIGIALVLLVSLAVGLPFLINPNQFRPKLEAELSSALARDVKVGDLKLAIFSGGVTAGDLSIADDPAYSRSPFLHAQAVTLAVDLWPLIFSRQLRITSLTLDQPQIDLLQSPAGDWNFSSLGGKSVLPARQTRPASDTRMGLSVKLVTIEHGRLTFAQQNGKDKARVLENVNVEVRNFSANSVFPFHLAANLAGGGDIQLDGVAGPINATDAAQTPAKVKLKLSGFDLAAAGVDRATGLAGLVAIDGVVASNGKTLFVNGRLKAEKLKLARNGSPAREPVEFDIALEHEMHQRSGTLRRGEIHLGNAPASLTGTYRAQGESVAVAMTLWGPQMAVPQLTAMLPAFGVVLPQGSSFQGGTAHAQLSFAGPIEALAIDGSLGLDDTRLTGFDLGSKMSTVEKLAGIKTGPDTGIQTFAATIHIAPDGSSVQDIHFVAPALVELSGAGTVSPSQALNFQMRATLHTGGAALAMLGAKSAAGVPFSIEGTAANPIFRPELKGMVSGLLGHVLGKKQK